MSKYQVTIQFEMDEEFMSRVPMHRSYINELIEKNIVDSYVVSMETQRCWITMNASTKARVKDILKKSSLHKYWQYEIDEIFLYDSVSHRLPGVSLN